MHRMGSFSETPHPHSQQGQGPCPGDIRATVGLRETQADPEGADVVCRGVSSPPPAAHSSPCWHPQVALSGDLWCPPQATAPCPLWDLCSPNGPGKLRSGMGRPKAADESRCTRECRWLGGQPLPGASRRATDGGLPGREGLGGPDSRDFRARGLPRSPGGWRTQVLLPEDQPCAEKGGGWGHWHR